MQSFLASSPLRLHISKSVQMETDMSEERANSQYGHLSNPSDSWLQVAEQHQTIEILSDKLYHLPINEFRQVPYRPPPLPANVPVVGKDITIENFTITVRDETEIALRAYRPINHKCDHLLFFNVHGGGWTVGSPESEEAQNRLLTDRNNAVVVSVDYRKAPEHPFPYALHDSQDALSWCKQHAKRLGVNPSKIVVGGGSAGANIVAVLVQMARNDGTTGIIGQILNIPVTCHPDHFPILKHEYKSFEQNADAPIVNKWKMRRFWDNYLPTADPTPMASPLLSESFAGLPPTLIQVAGMDPLRDEGLAYAQELQVSGVDVTLKVYAGMPHAFYVYPELPPSTEYFQSMVEWIDHLVSPNGTITRRKH